MQRESSRALAHNPSGEIRGAHAPPGIFVLDKAFVLIDADDEREEFRARLGDD
jgi:hypothetical protein